MKQVRIVNVAVAVAITMVFCASYRARGAENAETTDTLVADKEQEKKGANGLAGEVVLSPEAIAGFGIKMTSVKRRALLDSLVAPARVSFDGDAIAHISTAVEGRITEIKVKVGSRVSKGEELLVVDSPVLGEAQNDCLQKASAMGIAETAAEIARTDYERAKALYDSKVGSLSDKQKREAEYRTSLAQCHSAKIALATARNKLKLLGMGDAATGALLENGTISALHTVRAPIAGDVIERSATLGEVVGPATEALLVVADTSKIWVIADIPEGRLAQIHKGAAARIKVPAMQGNGFEGNVAYVSPSTDPQTRRGKARIEAANLDGCLKAGMFAEAEIDFDAKSAEQTTAPLVLLEEAIQTVDGTSCVFVPEADHDGHFLKRMVTIGASVGDMVPVYAGLAEGESVVTFGSFILKAELGKGSVEED